MFTYRLKRSNDEDHWSCKFNAERVDVCKFHSYLRFYIPSKAVFEPFQSASDIPATHRSCWLLSLSCYFLALSLKLQLYITENAFPLIYLEFAHISSLTVPLLLCCEKGNKSKKSNCSQRFTMLSDFTRSLLLMPSQMKNLQSFHPVEAWIHWRGQEQPLSSHVLGGETGKALLPLQSEGDRHIMPDEECLKTQRSNCWTKHVPEKAMGFFMHQPEASLENHLLVDLLVLKLRKAMSKLDYQVLSWVTVSVLSVTRKSSSHLRCQWMKHE